ncbi:hypothetical protein [Streptomyces zingiberis]|uniref:Uncharacterized protein n=1 Tax=Streptomyces zingiberis TaxID=2053010 RepID=A0ABX1BTH4_9ACTN|nr:hypothetical protein [Streptomyces zingiberis]NJP99710.1 hypothetical protein [Streptomyces zingiberis]
MVALASLHGDTRSVFVLRGSGIIEDHAWRRSGRLAMTIPSPDSVQAWLLGLIFGSPSFVVTTFVLANGLWAWWSFGRSAVVTAAIVFNRSQDRLGRQTLKVRASWRIAVAWTVCYASASVVTQIWAGSRYSPGQGGGLKELLLWSGLFGALAVAGCFYLTPSQGPKHGDPYWAPYLGMVGGYAFGLLWAVVAFTRRGPEPGDWWVCPAASCVGVLGSALRMRIRAGASR